jgi:hypothetical protein
VKIKNMAVVIALFLALTACEDKEPKPKPLPTTTISASVVQMCTDLSTHIRYKDKVCEDKSDGFVWVFLVDGEGWPAYIPAVGQVIEKGRYRTNRPAAMEIVTVPADGAYFTR